MLHSIEKELDVADAAIGESLHVLDTDNDGLVSTAELTKALGFLRSELGEEELALVLERLAEVQRSGGAKEGDKISVEALKAAAGPEAGGADGESVQIHIK